MNSGLNSKTAFHKVDTARSAYFNALEFWPRDFATRGM